MNLKKIMQNIKNGYIVITKPCKIFTRPISLNLEITNRCNCNCIMCSRENIKNFQDINFEKFKFIYDQIKPAFISMHGYGEPLLNNDLFDMIKYAKKNKSNTTITTNMILMNDDMLKKFLDSGLDLLKISFDTLNPENFKFIRGVDKFDTVLSNFKKTVLFFSESKNKVPDLRLSFTILPANYKEIQNIIYFAEELKQKQIFFQALLFYNSLLKNKNLGEINKQEFKNELIKSIDLSKKLNIITNLNQILSDFNNIFICYQKNSLLQKSKTVCLKPWLTVFISADGNVKPCDCLGLTDTVMGNIFKNSFDEIWNNKKYIEFRKDLKQNKIDEPVCAECRPNTVFDWLKYKIFVPKYSGE